MTLSWTHDLVEHIEHMTKGGAGRRSVSRSVTLLNEDINMPSE